MNAPLSLAFNAAVMTMARKVCPTGYDVSDQAPSSLEELNKHIARTRRIVVSNENSSQTIFGCPEHNFAFRAWHDWTHWAIQAPFTLEGERLVAYRQMIDIQRVFGRKGSQLFCLLIEEEVIGQAEYYAEHGEFPVDQVAFAKAYLAELDDADAMPYELRTRFRDTTYNQ